MIKVPSLAFSARDIVITLGAATILAALLQIALSASLTVVVLAVAASGVGLLAFLLEGPYQVGAWLALFYMLGNAFVALFSKTLLGQPINSHLDTPVDSFFTILISSLALFAALIIIRKINLGRPLLRRTSDPRYLSFLSWSCLVLGIVFWTLNQLFEDHGFGGFSEFRVLILMSVIGRTAMLLERSNDGKTFDISLGLILGVSIFLGILDDTKTDTALPVVTYFATVVFYRRRFPIKQLVALPICAFLFVAIMTPMIQALRVMGMERSSLVQRVDLLSTTLYQTIRHPSQFYRLKSLGRSEFKGGYYNYFGSNGSYQMLLGRFCSVQQIDPVIFKVNRQGARGAAEIWPALARLVPHFIYPGKPKRVDAYLTLVYYGLINPAGGKYPTLPIAGEAYAAFKMAGVFIIPFLTFLAFLAVVKKLGADLYRNAYAIFFLCEFIIIYSSQGSIGQFIGAAFRGFPCFAIIFLAVAKLYEHTRSGLHTAAVEDRHSPPIPRNRLFRQPR